MKTIFASIILAVVLPASTFAQGPSTSFDRLTPALPTVAERHAADVASWATALTVIALDAKASWDAPNRGRAFGLQATRLGVTYAASYIVKQMVGRQRPCSYETAITEGCGADGEFASFYSAHTAVAFQAVGGPRLAFALPLALGTGGLRVAAGKHWLTDTLAGAGIGLLTSRIR